MSQDTPVTPYTRPPVSTDSVTRDRLRDCRNLRQFMAICHILLYFAYLFLPQYLRYPQRPWLLPNSAKFCQDYDLKPILPCIHVNWVIKLIIYTPSFCFLISFFYVTSWFHYIVYVCSLIISTLLYIIATYTYSITLCCVNYLYYYIKYKINLKPL